MAQDAASPLSNDLARNPLLTDPNVYASFKVGKLHGLIATYIDDLVQTGIKALPDECRATQEMFDMTDKGELPFIFSTFKI